jgi:hypothetical protein
MAPPPLAALAVVSAETDTHFLAPQVVQPLAASAVVSAETETSPRPPEVGDSRRK